MPNHLSDALPEREIGRQLGDTCDVNAGDVGPIYRPEKVERALASCFRKDNLSTLRQLALWAAADEVRNTAASYRAREGLEPALSQST